MATPNVFHLKLPSGRVRVSDTGGKGRPILWLHSLAGDAEDALLFAPFLEGRRVISHDHQGLGPFATADEVDSLENLAQRAAEVAQALADEPVDVVGCSMGTVVGLSLMHRHPHLVRRAALLAPGGAVAPLEPLADLLKPLKVLPTLPGFQLAYALSNQWWWFQELASSPNETETQKEKLHRRALSRMAEKSPRDYALAVQATIGNLLKADTRSWISEVQHSTLLVMGGKDAWHFRRAAREYENLLPQGRLAEIPEARHLLWFSHPRQVAEMLEEHFS